MEVTKGRETPPNTAQSFDSIKNCGVFLGGEREGEL